MRNGFGLEYAGEAFPELAERGMSLFDHRLEVVAGELALLEHLPGRQRSFGDRSGIRPDWGRRPIFIEPAVRVGCRNTEWRDHEQDSALRERFDRHQLLAAARPDGARVTGHEEGHVGSDLRPELHER